MDIEELKKKLFFHTNGENKGFMYSIRDKNFFDKDMFKELTSIIDELIIYYKGKNEIDRKIAVELYRAHEGFMRCFFEVTRGHLEYNTSEDELFDILEEFGHKIDTLFIGIE